MNTSRVNVRRLSLSALALSVLMASSTAFAWPGQVIIVSGGGGGGGGGPYGCDPNSQSCADFDVPGTILTDDLSPLEMQGVRSVTLTMTITSDTGRVYEAQIAGTSDCTAYNNGRIVESVECDFSN